MVASVEEVTSSLVREYLSRKGLKGTIACMDEELPRTHNSINNRSELREILLMESIYKKNKVQQNPLKTLLEIIIKHHIEGHNTVFNDDPLRAAQNNPNANLTAVAGTSAVMNDNRTEDNSRPQHGSKDDISRSFLEEAHPYQSTTSLAESDRHTGHDRTDFWSGTSDIQRDQPLVAGLKENESFIKREREQRASISESHNGITENAQKNRTHTRIRRGMMAGPVASSSQESSKKRKSRRASGPHPLLGNEEDTSISTRGGPSMTGSHERSPKSGLTRLHTSRSTKERQPSRSPPEKGWSEEPFEKDKPRKKKSLSNQNMNDQHLSEMILDDVDDDEELRELSTLSLHSARPIPQCSYDSYPMDLHTAIALKEIFLGSSSSCFSTEWRNQGFTFSETPDLTYGIVQKKGGPCGVLASIQACVLKKLLFEGANGSNTGLQGLRPSCSTRRKCLMLAAAEVLWRAGEQKQATVAITSGRNNFIPPVHFKSEGVFEKIMCITVDNLKDLQLLLEQHIQLFENGALGCILLTISAVLSRSIEKVRDDMDVPTSSLIGAYGYCTQELVNLLLCGSAVSNVFDNDMELDSGNGNLTLLKGIKGHCDIGLLSLFEHYNICEVGAHLQSPRFPIWVVFSESHFSVLFGLQRELLTNRDEAQEFDLYYYDGLANQQEEIRLTVSVGIPALASQDVDTDLIPPLEHCIRTKWKDAVVNWNSTEPIL